MILLSLALFGFGVADLLRWSPELVSMRRALLATLGATSAAVSLAALAGLDAAAIAVTAVAAMVGIGVWLAFDLPTLKRLGPGFALAWIFGILLLAAGASGSAGGVSGQLAHWYSNLAFPLARSVGIDQFVVAICAGLVLLSTGNRVVRLVLEAAGTPPLKGETALRGGRVLGPMERVFVGALILSGDVTGAAIVIAAKGLLRLPEIRTSAEQHRGTPDQVTEYFLIGTFASLLLAGGLAAVVLGAG